MQNFVQFFLHKLYFPVYSSAKTILVLVNIRYSRIIWFLKVYLQASYQILNKPEVFSKVKPEPGSNWNPTRKALPDLQL